MNMHAFVAALAVSTFLAAPAALQAKITRTVEKSFPVQSGGNLRAATQGGSITVRAADVAEVRITATETIRADSDREADEILQRLQLTFEQTGNDVSAEAKYDRTGSGRLFGGDSPVQVSFTVTVPRKFNLSLHTSGGSIAVGSVQGSVVARTSGGGLKFDRIDGDLDGSTSGGSIELTEGTARAKLSTSGGSIRVDRAAGPTEVSTSGGNITLNSVAKLVGAHTSGGAIKATITEPIQDSVTLSTSGGSVTVNVPKTAAFEVDASTSGGSVISTGLALEVLKGAVGKNQLTAKVNGGGPLLKLRTSGGSIRVSAN